MYVLKVVEKSGELLKYLGKAGEALEKLEVALETVTAEECVHFADGVIVNLDDSNLDGLKELIREASNPVLVSFKKISRSHQQILDWCLDENNVAGVINRDQDITQSSFTLKSYVNHYVKVDYSHELTDLKVEMSELMNHVQQQLYKVKTLHKTLSENKKTDLDGIHLNQKFMSGTSHGGEFFDYSEKSGKICLYMSSCRSYKASNVALGAYNKLLEAFDGDEGKIEEMLLDLNNELKNLPSEKNHLDLFLGIIDRANLKFYGYSLGQYRLYPMQFASGPPLPLDNNQLKGFSIQLARNDKYTILSPGVFKNFDFYGVPFKPKNLFSDFKDRTPHETIHEIFYKLTKNNKEDFLQYDATVLAFEVDQNVIVKV